MRGFSSWFALIAIVFTSIFPTQGLAKASAPVAAFSPQSFLNANGSLSIPADFSGSLENLRAFSGPEFHKQLLDDLSETPTDEITPTDEPSETETLAWSDTPIPSTTPSPSESLTPSLAPSSTDEPTLTPTEVPSDTITQTPTASLTETITLTPSPSATPSLTPSQTPTLASAISGSWAALNEFSSLNGEVLSVAYSNGVIYAGGNFTDAGGDPNADFIAKFTGGKWSALGSGLNGGVYTIVVDDGVVYAGGAFQNAGGLASADWIAKFDGSNWSAVGNGLNERPNVLKMVSGTLYAGGKFTDAGGDQQADYIAKLVGNLWTSINGTGLSAIVEDILVDGSDIYAAGWFTDAGGDANADYVAVSSGGSGWAALGTPGVLNKTFALLKDGNTIYAGGGSNFQGRVAKFENGVWISLGLPHNGDVYDLLIIDNTLYVAGTFTNAGGNPDADYLAAYNGTGWSPLGQPSGLNNFVNSLIQIDDQLIAGGRFTDAGANSEADRIAQFGLNPIQYPTFTPTASLTASQTSTPSITITPTNSRTPSRTPTSSRTPTLTKTPSITPTPSITLTPSLTPTLTPSQTPTVPSPTFSVTPTPTIAPAGNPIFPVNVTITVRSPVFSWAEQSGALQYRFEVRKGGALVYTRTVTSPSCSGGICADTPPTSLTDGDYTWRVAAMMTLNVWGAYGNYYSFSVAPADFNSDFLNNTTGWTVNAGSWTSNADTYSSTGTRNRSTNIAHVDNYAYFTYEARIRWDGEAYGDAYLIFKGKPTPVNSYGEWPSAYYFSYDNDGYFNIYFTVGDYYYYYDYAYSNAIVTYGWNTLKVMAGGGYMEFYINGKLVEIINDITYVNGQVGLGAYTVPDAYALGSFSVDWAKLNYTFRGTLHGDQELDGVIVRDAADYSPATGHRDPQRANPPASPTLRKASATPTEFLGTTRPTSAITLQIAAPESSTPTLAPTDTLPAVTPSATVTLPVDVTPTIIETQFAQAVEAQQPKSLCSSKKHKG